YTLALHDALPISEEARAGSSASSKLGGSDDDAEGRSTSISSGGGTETSSSGARSMPEGAAPSTRGGAGRGARVPTPRVVERLGCFAGAGFAGAGVAGAGLAGRGGATAGSAAPSLTVGRGGGRRGAVVEEVSGVLWAGATPSIVDRVVRGGGGRPAPPDEALPSEAP